MNELESDWGFFCRNGGKTAPLSGVPYIHACLLLPTGPPEVDALKKQKRAQRRDMRAVHVEDTL